MLDSVEKSVLAINCEITFKWYLDTLHSHCSWLSTTSCYWHISPYEINNLSCLLKYHMLQIYLGFVWSWLAAVAEHISCIRSEVFLEGHWPERSNISLGWGTQLVGHWYTYSMRTHTNMILYRDRTVFIPFNGETFTKSWQFCDACLRITDHTSLNISRAKTINL